MHKTEQNIESLTRTSLLAKNTLYNLLGQIAPLFAALVAIPILVHRLGADRFGVLGISWVVLGYFGLFDLGLGRVITKMVAEKLGAEKKEGVAPIIWTGLGFMLILGLIMMLVLLALTPLFVRSLLKIPHALLDESFAAFLILAACVPIVILTTGLRSILEAYQMFGIVNVIRTVNGVFLYVAPLAVLPFTQSIRYVVLVLTLVRFFVFLLYLAACRRHITAMSFPPVFQRDLIKPMFKLGGWMSVSNIIGPVMVYFDRFLMGIWLSVTAVAYYVTPYEIISKAMVITTSVVHVLFPAFSMSITADPPRAALLYSRGNRILLLLFFPIILTIVVFAPWGMTLWLGSEFAEQSTGVLQWLAIGVMINAFGQVAFAAIQAAGRADITAKLHLVEMPFYLLALYLFIKWFGITGAAIAWTGRMVVDTVVLFYVTEKNLNAEIPKSFVFRLLALVTFFLLSLYITFFEKEQHILFYLLILIGFLFPIWSLLLLPEERASIRGIFKRSKRVIV